MKALEVLSGGRLIKVIHLNNLPSLKVDLVNNRILAELGRGSNQVFDSFESLQDWYFFNEGVSIRLISTDDVLILDEIEEEVCISMEYSLPSREGIHDVEYHVVSRNGIFDKLYELALPLNSPNLVSIIRSTLNDQKLLSNTNIASILSYFKLRGYEVNILIV